MEGPSWWDLSSSPQEAKGHSREFSLSSALFSIVFLSSFSLSLLFISYGSEVYGEEGTRKKKDISTVPSLLPPFPNSSPTP